MVHKTSGGPVDIQETFDSWDHSDQRETNANNSLRPIGAEHRATACGVIGDTGKNKGLRD